MRLPVSLVEPVKKEAARVGIPYPRYIRQILEAALHHRRIPPLPELILARARPP
jgi:hypothetical protein